MKKNVSLEELMSCRCRQVPLDAYCNPRPKPSRKEDTEVDQ